MYVCTSVDVGLYEWGTSVFGSSSVPHIGLDVTSFKHDFQQRHEPSLVCFKISVDWTTLGCLESTPQNMKVFSCDGILGSSKEWKYTQWMRLYLAGIIWYFPYWRTVPSAGSLLPVTRHWHCWLTTAAAPGAAARLQPGVPLIYRVCLKLRFTWGSSPSHSVHHPQPGRWLQGTRGCACVYRCAYSRAAAPQEQLFLGCLELWVNMLAMTSTVWQLLALPLTAVWGERKETEDFCTAGWRGAVLCLCFTQAQRRHAVRLLVFHNSDEAGSLAEIPSQPPLWC